MISKTKYDVIIIGGGLAGLTCALHLSNHTVSILVIEKNTFPHHKVCGEYVSNEVLPYLNSLGIDPMREGATKISKLILTSPTNKKITATLPLGGFGMSRYYLDNLLYTKVKDTVDVVFDTVENITFNSKYFTVSTQSNITYQADYVIGGYGKRSNIDKKLNREFIQQKSSWLAVKAHYTYDFPKDTVALHTFKGGYCGLSKTENGVVNACYLTTYNSFKKHKGIEDYQKNNMSENPALKSFFSEATSRFDTPQTIGQISFQPKKPVENHIFMVGDSAGLIHPLCGNGMAMAIHSAKLFSEIFLNYYKPKNENRDLMEKEYKHQWNKMFSKRLKTGRYIQKLLMNQTTAAIGFSAMSTFPFLLKKLIQQTHGKPID